jgi:hypothetical protein
MAAGRLAAVFACAIAGLNWPDDDFSTEYTIFAATSWGGLLTKSVG